MVKLSDIERLGLCSGCRQWCSLEEEKDCLPEHEGKNGEKCPGSKHSYLALKYHIKTPGEATAVAKFIVADKGGCLRGGGMHSMACGDGEYCENERLLWAQALAEYFLANNS